MWTLECIYLSVINTHLCQCCLQVICNSLAEMHSERKRNQKSRRICNCAADECRCTATLQAACLSKEQTTKWGIPSKQGRTDTIKIKQRTQPTCGVMQMSIWKPFEHHNLRDEFYLAAESRVAERRREWTEFQFTKLMKKETEWMPFHFPVLLPCWF